MFKSKRATCILVILSLVFYLAHIANIAHPRARDNDEKLLDHNEVQHLYCKAGTTLEAGTMKLDGSDGVDFTTDDVASSANFQTKLRGTASWSTSFKDLSSSVTVESKAGENVVTTLCDAVNDVTTTVTFSKLDDSDKFLPYLTVEGLETMYKSCPDQMWGDSVHATYVVGFALVLALTLVEIYRVANDHEKYVVFSLGAILHGLYIFLAIWTAAHLNMGTENATACHHRYPQLWFIAGFAGLAAVAELIFKDDDPLRWIPQIKDDGTLTLLDFLLSGLTKDDVTVPPMRVWGWAAIFLAIPAGTALFTIMQMIQFDSNCTGMAEFVWSILALFFCAAFVRSMWENRRDKSLRQSSYAAFVGLLLFLSFYLFDDTERVILLKSEECPNIKSNNRHYAMWVGLGLWLLQGLMPGDDGGVPARASFPKANFNHPSTGMSSTERLTKDKADLPGIQFV